MLEIPDTFFLGGWGWGGHGTVDAGPEPTYVEKMRVPPSPGVWVRLTMLGDSFLSYLLVDKMDQLAALKQRWL